MTWSTVVLAECCEIVSGATPKTNVAQYWDGDINWVTPADLSKLDGAYISRTPRRITDAGLASCAASMLPAGSVLLSSRAPIGHVAINSEPMATNQGFKSLVPNARIIDAKYLYHWLRAHTTYLQSLGNGATFKELSKATVARIEVPAPPLEEQRRIAAILDRAHELRATSSQVLAGIDALVQSVFLDMFGEPDGWPSRWSMGTVEDLAESVQYGTSMKAGMSGEFPILRMGNVTYSGRLDLSDLKFVDLEGKDVDKYTVRRGDLVFNRTNSAELVGKTAVIDTDRILALAGYLIRVRLRDGHRPEFVSAYLNSRYGKAMLRGMAKSAVNQANINASELRNIRIAIPPSAIQAEFVQRIAGVESKRDAVEATLGIIDELTASLARRAFSGLL